MKKWTSVSVLLLSLMGASGAMAQTWYQTPRELKIGEQDGVCVVVAQLSADHGSQPLIVDWATEVCSAAYSNETKDGQTIQALMNGASKQIVNCIVCAAAK